MILTVGNTKGGVGKSTLAFNIAVARALAGRDVLVVDTDQQRSASTFTATRTAELGAPGYTAVYLEGEDVRTQVRQLARKYEDIVIDAGGRDTDSLRSAMLASDVVLIPVQPRSVDVWALGTMMKVLRLVTSVNTELRALMVLNFADPQGRDNEETAELLRGTAGVTLLDTTIGRRKVFADAATFGRSVLDYARRDQKAIEELQAILNAIYQY